MFIVPIVITTRSGRRVSPAPMNQPAMTSVSSTAGALARRIEVKEAARSAISSLGVRRRMTTRHHGPLHHQNANAQPGREQGRALSVG